MDTPNKSDQQSNPEPQPTSKLSGKLVFGIGAVIIVLVAVIVFLLIREPATVTTDSDSKLPIATGSQDTGDETSSWQTYRSEEFGFEMKVPVDWTIESQGASEELFFFSEESRKENSLRVEECKMISVKSGDQALECAQRNVDLYFTNVNYDRGTSSETINGIEWHVYYGENTGWEYETKQGEHGFNFRPLEQLELPANKQDFINILSTFKFLDQDQTADWQTYRNTRVGYEFEFPSSGLSLDLDETIKYPSALSVGNDLVQFATGGVTYGVRSSIEVPYTSIKFWIQDPNNSNISSNLSDYTKIIFGDKVAYTSKTDLATYTLANGNIYMITAHEGVAPSTDISDPIYQHLISTFKFIN
ncbi:MAG: hypothetical protein COT91_03790 [Candidatus Doudnabacteria bacterium CG10_big_fil_rev_8_21_14_0_10_41_10]|uniref:Uncharacterized protein n=1 Tax=Candidatus Doudnabacteria bacterium CG10_big_fil_rev_8_21_14_0_10_41_10 TaxID=1974551 RepID=A0A2H0VD30_9BACT|nr:MAG: hypothetical protein COT91_03790 [Candidatus Doudnabacteria bacterium CG10_big_fil_rev_8_21_14_0_10_41_10]